MKQILRFPELTLPSTCSTVKLRKSEHTKGGFFMKYGFIGAGNMGGAIMKGMTIGT